VSILEGGGHAAASTHVRHRLLRALGCSVALALHTNNHGSREVIL
jgi:hypothetical protein